MERKIQIEGDTSIPENSIIIVTDEVLTADDIPTHQHTKSEITDFPTIPTIPDITVNNGNVESGKYISQVAVDGTNKHKLNITKENLPTGFSGNYNDLTNKPTIPTVPTISIDITTDATSDAKTASPKAVKSYVDNAISTVSGGGGAEITKGFNFQIYYAGGDNEGLTASVLGYVDAYLYLPYFANVKGYGWIELDCNDVMMTNSSFVVIKSIGSSGDFIEITQNALFALDGTAINDFNTLNANLNKICYLKGNCRIMFED